MLNTMYPGNLGYGSKVLGSAFLEAQCDEFLAPYLIETCVEACPLSVPTEHTPKDTDKNETLVMIALELRSPEVHEFFLKEFSGRF